MENVDILKRNKKIIKNKNFIFISGFLLILLLFFIFTNPKQPIIIENISFFGESGLFTRLFFLNLTFQLLFLSIGAIFVDWKKIKLKPNIKDSAILLIIVSPLTMVFQMLLLLQ